MFVSRLIVEGGGMPNIEDSTNRIAQLDPARQAVVERLVQRLESAAPKAKMTLDEIVDEFEREHPELLHLLAQ